MTLIPSLRVRLVLGLLLWTGGLIHMSHLTSVFLFFGGLERFHGVAHLFSLATPASLAMVGGVWLLRGSLSSIKNVHTRVTAVHEGREPRVGGTHPSEVQPLVDDLNALLDHRDRRVRDALAKAGDLAHGLKTPLAVLAQEAERARAAGHADLADTIGQQVDRMRRQMDYHLAHARAAASGATPGARCLVAESAEGLARTLRRLHAARGLTIDVATPAGHAARAQREDLDEMLGNLMDNACQWAKTRVRVSSSNSGERIILRVEDDGPGLDASLRALVLQRGVRADEAAPGTGFGLAIVRDLAELYGGSITLEDSDLGGLRARLELPASH